MGIKIPIEGLSQFIEEIPEGVVISIQGGSEPTPSLFVQVLAQGALKQEKAVIYITSRKADFITNRLGHQALAKDLTPGSQDISTGKGLQIESGNHPAEWKKLMPKNGMVVIDCYSYLVSSMEDEEIRRYLEDLRDQGQSMDCTILLVLEDGMLSKKAEAIVGHLSDGIIQFHTKETKEGVAHFMRIPKWVDGRSLDQNIYYTFEEGRFNIDLRARVV